MNEVKRVTSPRFRAAFARVFNPNPETENYEVTMLFGPEANLNELKALVKNAAVEKWGDKLPKGLNTPFKKGDDKDEEAYPDFQGHVYANAKSKFQPKVVDGQVQPILDQEEFYSGCYARASLTAYAWEYKGKKGVSFNLNNIQKLADGERMGGGFATAEDDFDVVETETEVDLGDDDFDL